MKQMSTLVLVEDIKRSNRFYRDVLGLEVVHDWESMMVYNNRLSIHQADLLLPQERVGEVLRKGKQGAGNLVIYLQVEDETLEECFSRLQKAGVEFVHEILDLPWQQIFRVYDPDGHIIEIGGAKKPEFDDYDE